MWSESAGPELRDLGTEPRWREERWRREMEGMEHRDCWERTRGGPGWAEEGGEEAVVGEEGRGGQRPNTA